MGDIFQNFMAEDIAANNAQMNQMYQCLVFSIKSVNAIIQDQGINTLEEVRQLEPMDVETICKTIQCLGGTITPHGDAEIANPSIAVLALAESNLKIATWCLMHMHHHIQYNKVPADVTHNVIHPFHEQMHNEAN